MQRMPLSYSSKQPQIGAKKRSQRLIIVGACVLVAASAGLLYTILTGATRRQTVDPFVPTTTPTSTSTAQAVRRLDGVLVNPGDEAKRPISVMIDNQAAALPWSGLDQASLVIESPVEGGITRLMAFFDPLEASSTKIGAVRSARPYFVEWAKAWQAGYVHVGGSPEALDKIKGLGSSFANIDEMANGPSFFRDSAKVAPHNVFATLDSLKQAMERRYGTSTASFANWRFEPLATSTNAVVSAPSIRIPYGGAYSVTWRFDPQLGQYRRLKGTAAQTTREGKELLASNVAVIKTDAQVLDSKGRLSLRTVGGGDAVLYRAGKKYVARWSRSQDEIIRFEGADGSEYPLTVGPTWIQVTTDDRVFAGLTPSPTASTTAR
jgi:hypothetical protein